MWIASPKDVSSNTIINYDQVQTVRRKNSGLTAAENRVDYEVIFGHDVSSLVLARMENTATNTSAFQTALDAIIGPTSIR